MSHSKTIDELFMAFIEQLKVRNRINLVPVDKQRWFRGAYSTIQRTLRSGFTPLSRQEKVSCSDLLFMEIPRLSGQEFDLKLQSLIRRTAKEFNVSIGHAQKLISILMKYGAAAHCHPLGQIPDDWRSLVQSDFGRFPVPIDAIVLFRLKSLYPERFQDIDAGAGRDESGRQTYWARVSSSKSSEAWSRLSSYQTYWFLQKRIRDLASAEQVAPLEFEMRHLWLNK